MKLILGLIFCFVILQIAVRLWPVATNHSFFARAQDALGCGAGADTSLVVPGGYAQSQPMDDAAFQDLVQAAAALPRAKVIRQSPGAATLVVRSRVWGFPDVLNLTHADGCTVAAGHLTLGHSDMGVNRARITSLLSPLSP